MAFATFFLVGEHGVGGGERCDDVFGLVGVQGVEEVVEVVELVADVFEFVVEVLSVPGEPVL